MNIMGIKTSTLAVCILVGMGSQALASPYTVVTVDAGFNSNTLSGPTATSLTVTGSGIAGIGTASASAFADFGTLGVSTSGSATPGPQTGGPTITSLADASFNDLLFIGGPAGAPVQLTFTLDLNGTSSATAGGTSGLPNASSLTQGSLALPGTGVSVSDTNLSNSTTFTWVGGNPLPISGDLNARGSAYNGGYTALFADTLHFYVSSTTPGVDITSQSGHNYSPAPVPVPSTLVLFGTGLLALMRRRVHREKTLKNPGN